jgi:hypothetical protein
MEIDRRENNKDFNSWRTVKTFAIGRSRSFGRIRLHQTDKNHWDNSYLLVSAFENLRAIAGLQ